MTGRQAAPIEADTISASPGLRPQCSQAPRPCSPSTPSASDSSTTKRYLRGVHITTQLSTYPGAPVSATRSTPTVAQASSQSVSPFHGPSGLCLQRPGDRAQISLRGGGPLVIFLEPVDVSQGSQVPRVHVDALHHNEPPIQRLPAHPPTNHPSMLRQFTTPLKSTPCKL